MFCFFKQKTAYEMRISDWSSDVCSSDLVAEALLQLGGELLGLTDHREGVEDLVGDEVGHLLPLALLRHLVEVVLEAAPAVQLEHGPVGGGGAVERSEERRVGKEGVSKGGYRWSRGH